MDFEQLMRMCRHRQTMGASFEDTETEVVSRKLADRDKLWLAWKAAEIMNERS